MNETQGRDAHWFDGDGMLSGVTFRRTCVEGRIEPEFVNQYILTDVFLSTITSPALKTPILPSITTLVNPLSSLLAILLSILRTIVLVVLSHLPGSQQTIKKISVANTSILYHDGRALATCESGVPMRISLPGLDTVGWFNGRQSEGEGGRDAHPGFGGNGFLSFMKEWTTAHPRVDPKTSELLLFHSTFVPPYVHYSIIPSSMTQGSKETLQPRCSVLNAPVSGIRSAKMMHDFGVSSTHTIIMDLPLSLDPLNLVKNIPVVSYDPSGRSRFGVFPRYQPSRVLWFETNPCCIFHTANSWDSTVAIENSTEEKVSAVNLLACRLTSATLVYSAGDLAAPIPLAPLPNLQEEEEQCRLYFYQFRISPPLGVEEYNNLGKQNVILHQWALSAIPFEFPSVRDSVSMSAAKYIYGCSVAGATFGAALGRAVKINSLVKVDVETLIAKGMRSPPTQITGCVDKRNMAEILASKDPEDSIKVFKMPEGWYAQEPRFVPRDHGRSEDDGWLLSYVFDEAQLDSTRECPISAKSELWIIDAKNMKDVVAKIYLPQRVPYGLHGNWFSEEQLQSQRPVERLRTLPTTHGKIETGSPAWRCWMGLRGWLERTLS